jgi:hypothetical protein
MIYDYLNPNKKICGDMVEESLKSHYLKEQ